MPPEQLALRTARTLLDLGFRLEAVLANSLISAEHRDFVRAELAREQNQTLIPARSIVADPTRNDWLAQLDRLTWFYWPALRTYLLARGWDGVQLRSLDDSSDRILRQLAPPTQDEFDIRGLVLGYVQSGKTASFTAVIAKAADAGYRLVIVLSGIDNSLRRQTQIRLNRELVGYADNRSGAVHLPPIGRQWHQFTSEDWAGDFRAGHANYAALQGSQPVLLVVKKNGAVLRRLHAWLDAAPEEVRRALPVLVIDDEADQASVDTRGSYQVDEEQPDAEEYEPPSRINGLIRELLGKFRRCAYVAYTATPFANILIPHDTADPRAGNDLYPKDFIIDLPKPNGYFGAEELFGRLDPETGGEVGGIDIVREVGDEDLAALGVGQVPEILEAAILDFVLAGAARAQRGQSERAATMLVHTSPLIAQQGAIRGLVAIRFGELRDEWRYDRDRRIQEILRQRWETEFRPVTRARHVDRDVAFAEIEPHLGAFFEAVQVREINSATGEALDYEREPELKAIAVGGNRLSRGLTLEGLLVSFFVRRSVMYDTLMQMGRWFGFRGGYDDLTRIYTSAELAGWFSDLALVEHRLREDLRVYEEQGLTPYQVGMRISLHPTMQVTSALKRRFASATTIAQSYSGQLEQTFKFPLRRLDDLAVLAEENLQATRTFLSSLGGADWTEKGPVWTGRSAEEVVAFLRAFELDEQVRNVSLPLICAYIERLAALGSGAELVRWTVAVRGRESLDPELGEAQWNVAGGRIRQISRTRQRHTDSLGVITSPGDEALGLGEEARTAMQARQDAGETENRAARLSRPPEEGLLLLYPISRYSGYELRDPARANGNREPLYPDAREPRARDLIGMALSFPESRHPQRVEAYLEGTAGWRPVE